MEYDMRIVKLGTALMLGLGLAACASPETASRNAPLDVLLSAPAALPIHVQEIRVSVPKSLKVSEANRYLPSGDIVWREEAPGDRHAQVKAILETAFDRGASSLPQGTVPVVLDVELERFHALSEKARYTVGGRHGIRFSYVLRDAATGAVLTAPKSVDASFRALGGQEAINAERKGITQKVRITEHLAQVIREELSTGGGDPAQAVAMLRTLNRI
jgi:hypothetical protein